MKKYLIVSRTPKFRRSGMTFIQDTPTILSDAEVTPEILAEPMLEVVELVDESGADEPAAGTGVDVGVPRRRGKKRHPAAT